MLLVFVQGPPQSLLMLRIRLVHIIDYDLAHIMLTRVTISLPRAAHTRRTTLSNLSSIQKSLSNTMSTGTFRSQTKINPLPKLFFTVKDLLQLDTHSRSSSASPGDPPPSDLATTPAEGSFRLLLQPRRRAGHSYLHTDTPQTSDIKTRPPP